ncbi:11048_t:CDS:2 [Dentiscutata erythropus]|uniref:11048_t:CDS:1 n=1 Tax=Dentiscutata erythropus TaxID=1348616 RepID=A0A9N8WM90_9GLOM|nr:11048_t:CDS:2 [Dentiscutata erythropus]
MIILDSIQQEERYNFNDEDLKFKLDRLKSGAGNLLRSMFTIMLAAIFYSTLCISYGLFHKTETTFIRSINMMYILIWNVAIPGFLHICQIIHILKRSNFGYGISGNLVIPLVTSPIISNFEIIRNENNENELPYYVNSVYEDDRKFLSNKTSTNNIKNIEESKIFERMRENQFNQVIESSSSKISYTRSSNASTSICKESSKERNVNKDWLIEAPKKVLIRNSFSS